MILSQLGLTGRGKQLRGMKDGDSRLRRLREIGVGANQLTAEELRIGLAASKYRFALSPNGAIKGYFGDESSVCRIDDLEPLLFESVTHHGFTKPSMKLKEIAGMADPAGVEKHMWCTFQLVVHEGRGSEHMDVYAYGTVPLGNNDCGVNRGMRYFSIGHFRCRRNERLVPPKGESN